MTDEGLFELIPYEAMVQYELLRQMGNYNMFDMYNVLDMAYQMDFLELSDEVGEEHYTKIISNFGKLMKHYNIDQSMSIQELMGEI